MSKSLIARIFLLVCLLVSPVGAQTTDEEILARSSDENAASTQDRQRVLAVLLSAARRGRTEGDNSKAAGFLNRAGQLQMRLSQPRDAVLKFEEALSLTEHSTDSTVHVDALNGIAAAYAHSSMCQKTQTFTTRAIDLSEKNKYVAGKAAALLTLSDCQSYSNLDLAIQTVSESLRLSESIGNKAGMARAYISLADYQFTKNDLEEATRNNEAALNLWRELNLPSEQAEVLISLGYVEYRKGAWENCLTLMAQAQTMLDEKAEPFKMGQIAAGIGEAFIENGMPEAGLIKLKQASDYYHLADTPREVVGMQWDIGRTYFILGRYAEALLTLRETMREAESMKNLSLIALCHDYLGRVHEATEDETAALEHYQTAIELYSKLGRPREAARTSALIGRLFEKRGQLSKAEESYHSALKTFAGLTDRINQSATLYALGRLELRKRDLTAAEAHLRESIEVTENMRRVSTSRDLTTAFSATVYDRYQSYVECLMRKSESGRRFDVQAFQISELARGRALAELLSATQTNLFPGIDSQLAERERRFRQSLRAKEDYKVTLLATKYQKEELEAVSKALAELETQYKQVVETIRERYPAYDQISRPTSWDLKRIQTEVITDDQTLLLEYSLGSEKSYVWAVTNRSLSSYELPPERKISATARGVYELLKTSPDPARTAALNLEAQKLAQMILSPVAAELSQRTRIIIVADGALNYIPFQMLPSANGEPLILNYEIVNAPSASILGQLQQEAARRDSPRKILAAFGDPAFPLDYAQLKNGSEGETVAQAQTPENFRWRSALRDIEPEGDTFAPEKIQRLFYARRELMNLREVAGDQTSLATGFEASRERLESADLTKFAIVHFATHGILDPTHPERSGFFLSMVRSDGQPQNGFIGLSDIYRLRVPVKLVVLSACRTGLGKEVRGEGLIGLTRGFMYAGASSVVASLWKVDDEATSELMKRFYMNMLQREMTPAKALQAAQNSIRLEANWSSPYYWAAFTLQGNYRDVIKAAPVETESVRELIIIGVALLIIFPLMLVSYRRMRIAQAATTIGR